MEITGLFAGKPQPFGPRKSPSSIVKASQKHLRVLTNGAVEDEQGDKKLHGGPQMALHQYAQESYLTLQEAFPSIADKLQFGSIGENISAAKMNENNVYIGDIYQIGEVSVQVSSPRAPCSRINQRYGIKKVDLFILEQGITGWYLRVLQEGTINVGDKITLEHRDDQAVSVKDLMHMSKTPKGISYTRQQLEHAATLETLSPEWQGKLKRILKRL
ncbi:MOSC domain-containing protein [Glaciecola sp. SC05]|uniref:MOSC domain-containing protein n=1 Tax=Glaciecola sp. SC05 TaxID=1987355 RepID=UPI003527C30F